MESTPTRRTRNGSGRVKLAEVAREANVSTATVSRAFNEPSKVSEEVRERVFQAARALNWIPDAAGKALASSKTHIAGAIIPTLDNEIFASQISGMQSVFSKHDFTLLLGCSNYDPQEGLRQARAMLARGVEAISIVGEDHPPELFEALQFRGVPYVVTYSYREGSSHPCIGFDNYAAFCTIVENLLSLGHRRFGAIFQPVENNDRASARLQAVRDTLSRAGITLEDRHCLIGPSTMAFGGECLRNLMGREDRPTAIVCGNDNIALGALVAAGQIGISAPTDFSITGFDDLEMASHFHPALSTMKVNNHEIGVEAARQLIAVLKGERDRPMPVPVAPQLKLRESTGHAAG